jgi:hypothetical protein
VGLFQNNHFLHRELTRLNAHRKHVFFISLVQKVFTLSISRSAITLISLYSKDESNEKKIPKNSLRVHRFPSFSLLREYYVEKIFVRGS